MKRQPIAKLARADYAAIPRYGAGPESAINLADNTNQWGSPPAAVAAMRRAAGISNYPRMYGEVLKETIAAINGISADCVVTGNGSDDILDCTIRAFAEPGDLLAHPDPTFVMVPTLSRISHLVPVPVALKSNWEMDAAALLATGARIIYLCSPNNPTSTASSADMIRKVIAKAPGIVIVDEAYVEFSGESGFLAEAPALERVVVCRTMSKAYGLAGLRVGYATASHRIIEAIEKSRGPYKLNSVGEAAAVAALTDDREWVAAHVAEAVANRDRLAAELRTLGLDPLPSAANFLLVPTSRAPELAAQLAVRGIGVRFFTNLACVGNSLRITVGPWPMMESLIAALKDVF